MPFFALIYRAVDDYADRRLPFRQAHLEKAAAATERGELLLGGAFTDPVDTALLIFRAEDRSIVEAFARDDPYVTNGLVTEWDVREWNVVVGSVFDVSQR